MWDGYVGEEAIIEEGTFKGKVDQGVEEVPDEEDAEFGSRRDMEDAERSSICCDEDREGCKEGEDGCLIDYQGARRRLGLHVRELYDQISSSKHWKVIILFPRHCSNALGT